MGGMSGLNTMASQAYGAKNYPRLGVLLQRTILMCLCLCVPIGFSWYLFTGPVLMMIGIEREQAELRAQREQQEREQMIAGASRARSDQLLLAS